MLHTHTHPPPLGTTLQWRQRLSFPADSTIAGPARCQSPTSNPTMTPTYESISLCVYEYTSRTVNAYRVVATILHERKLEYAYYVGRSGHISNLAHHLLYFGDGWKNGGGGSGHVCVRSVYTIVHWVNKRQSGFCICFASIPDKKETPSIRSE